MNRKKKLLAILLIAAMIGGIIPALSGTSSAQSSFPQVTSVKYGYNGYDGNGVIYKLNSQFSCGLKATQLSSLYSNINSNNYKWCGQSDHCWVNTSCQVASGVRTPNDPMGNSSFYYASDSAPNNTGGGKLCINLNLMSLGQESYWKSYYDTCDVNMIKNYISLSGFGTTASACSQNSNGKTPSATYHSPMSSGVNLSSGSIPWGSNPNQKAIGQIISTGVSMIPVVGEVYSIGKLAYELHNDFGPSSPFSSTMTHGGNGNICQSLYVINGTVPTYGGYSTNHYISFTNASICIPTGDMNTGCTTSCSIVIGSKSYFGMDGSYNHVGASATMTIPLKPSILLVGSVGEGGNSGSVYSNKHLCLVQTYDGVSTGFQITTNTGGDWEFYAQPGATYVLTGQNLSVPGCSGSWNYNLCNIPSSCTSINNVGKVVVVNPNHQRGYHFEVNVTDLNGYVKANGNPVENAEVYMEINGKSESVMTNSAGYFSLTVPWSSTVTVSIYRAGYNYNTQTISVDTMMSDTLSFSYTTSTSGGDVGGGGCVLFGTNITLANGSTVQVQNLYRGEKILSYNTNKDRFFTDKVKQIIITQNVTSIIRIDNFISLSGPTVQPVYVQTANGTDEWIFLGQITDGMSLYSPLNNTWVKVTNITIVIGSFTVYEVIGSKEFWDQGHKRTDYIANGILVDRKTYI